MNNLFCGAHVIINMAASGKSAVKEFESIAPEQMHHKGFVRADSSRTFGILMELSKGFCAGYQYQKTGAVSFWQPYIESKGLKSKFISFKEERINILFVNAAAAYYHKGHILGVSHPVLSTAELSLGCHC